MRRLAAAVVVSLLLAGCSDPGPAAEPEGPDTAKAQVDRDTGAISGVVVDPTVTPVVGAEIRLNDGRNASTNERGQFVFEKLTPGLYVLSVQAPGHLPVQSSADVAAGQVAKPRIMLPIDTSPVPVPVTTQFEGWIEVADAWASWILMDVTGNTELCQCEFTAELGPDAHTVVMEAFWTPSAEVNDPDMWYDIYPPEGGDEYGEISSPAREVFDATDWGTGETRVVYSVRTTVAIQQEFEVFFTVWYHGPPPEGWSVTDGE